MLVCLVCLVLYVVQSPSFGVLDPVSVLETRLGLGLGQLRNSTLHSDPANNNKQG
jgi:hypothetical protein